MQNNVMVMKNTNGGKVIFISSLVVLLYWLAGQFVDIYHFVFAGAVFELLWLPMLAALFCLPVLAFIFWTREKFAARSLYLYAVLVGIITILIHLFSK